LVDKVVIQPFHTLAILFQNDGFVFVYGFYSQ